MTLRKHDHTVGGRTAGGWRRTLWLTLGILALGMRAAMAQTFTSGSTGADGALNLTGTPPGTVIDFDPAAFTPALDTDGDSVYHFTTITIAANVMVRLRANKAGAAPIHWLATGARGDRRDSRPEWKPWPHERGPEDSVGSRSRGLCWWHRTRDSQSPTAGRLRPGRRVCRWGQCRTCNEHLPRESLYHGRAQLWQSLFTALDRGIRWGRV
jgi:hypothetical protein